MPKIISSTKITHEGGVKMAIHSAAGVGKTILTATLKKPLIILTEVGGAESLNKDKIKEIYGKDAVSTNIPIVPSYSVADFEEALAEYLNDDRFDTIVIDSVSELSKLLLKEITPKHKNKLQAYGEMAEHIDDLIRGLNKEEKNIVYLFHSVAQETYDEDGEPSSTVVVPSFEGQKMRTEFPFLNGNIFCLLIDYGDDGEPQRFLRTRQGDTIYYAKNRNGMLDELEPPHLQKLINKLTS